MSMFALLALTLSAPALAVAMPPEPGQQRGDQDRAFRQMREGRILPLPEIERRVVPMMRGAQYLGPEFDPDRGIYTLKFLRDGAVIWVMVDARSGQIVGRTR